MKLIHNERGGALLIYLLAISIILMIVTPVLLNLSFSSTQKSSQEIDDKLAYSLAVGGMESFVSYLNNISETDNRITYFNQFPGWGMRSFQSPEHVQIIYKAFVGTEPETLSGYNPGIIDSGKYTVTMIVSAGKHSKSLSYEFDVQNMTGGSVEAGQPSEYNEVIVTPAPGEPVPYDTNEDNVLTWEELQAATGAETFDEFYDDVVSDFVGAEYTKVVYSLNELITYMQSDPVKNMTGQVTVRCSCPAMDLSDYIPKNTTYDFVTGYQASAFVVQFDNSLSLSAGNQNSLWKMKGMIAVNGDLSLEDRFFEVSNIFVNGNFYASSGSKQEAYCASSTYEPSPSSDPTGGIPVTYVSYDGSSAWNPEPQ